MWAALSAVALEATVSLTIGLVPVATPDTPPARKLTQAPEPMASVRGSGSRATVPDDTDDLDAFSRKFFKRA